MTESVLWFDEVDKDDVESVGGKGASLGEMAKNDFPVPDGFVVTAQAYRRLLQDTGVEDDLEEALDIDVEDSDALEKAHDRAVEIIRSAGMPDDMRKEIEEAYEAMGDEPFVAVRSSATAEDLPDASFAGQQETYLNVQGADELVERVKDCWASLFTERAIYYRVEKGFSHEDVNIAVVVQEMVDADKSGVAFSSDPSTGDKRVTVEAAWGLGEAVVSGGVTPDNYVFDRETREVLEAKVACKKVMHVKDVSTGETVEKEVPDERRDERVLTEDEIVEITDVAERLEEHYGTPQDIEWAIYDGELYVLQSRPITTIAEGDNRVEEDEDAGEVLVEGLSASPGKESGTVRIVRKLDEIDRIEEGDVMVTEQTTPDMVPAMKRSAAIVTDEGGLTSHAAIVSRELGKVAVVGTGNATTTLEDGDFVTVDGSKGKVTRGKPNGDEKKVPEYTKGDGQRVAEPQPVTATDVKVNVSIPDAAESAAETGADGVGLLRMEHMVLELGKTPAKYVGDHGERAYIDRIVEGVQEVAEAFYPRPVRVRTLDAPTDEFRNLEGGDSEPVEHNPMMGYRGIRRALDEPDIFELELRAFRKLYDLGYDNIEIMLPLVNDADETAEARELMERAGLDTDEITWGIMIETPASAMTVEDIADEGVDFVSFGTNDLTQYTLAADRNNEHVADIYNETHPGVLALMSRVIEICRDKEVRTSICGQAGSNPEMVEFLVEEGITSVSANIDAVRDVRQRVARVEKRLMLDHARGDGFGGHEE
ncbi:MAG: phosphoenolpyruvate synthase [Halobacteriales archaeon]|nr:phosphoenolpyruvate synthase [Halobacteriales archaeon]